MSEVLQSARRLCFIPEAGLLLMCDFDGYLSEEIGPKIRPVVVISPVMHNWQAPMVVPLSHGEAYGEHTIKLCPDHYPVLDGQPSWAKVQCATHVGLSRLDRMKFGGKHRSVFLEPHDLARIHYALLAFLTGEPVGRRAA